MQASIARTQNRISTQIIQNKFFVFEFMLTRFCNESSYYF